MFTPRSDSRHRRAHDHAREIARRARENGPDVTQPSIPRSLRCFPEDVDTKLTPGGRMVLITLPNGRTFAVRNTPAQRRKAARQLRQAQALLDRFALPIWKWSLHIGDLALPVSVNGKRALVHLPDRTRVPLRKDPALLEQLRHQLKLPPRLRDHPP